MKKYHIPSSVRQSFIYCGRIASKKVKNARDLCALWMTSNFPLQSRARNQLLACASQITDTGRFQRRQSCHIVRSRGGLRTRRASTQKHDFTYKNDRRKKNFSFPNKGLPSKPFPRILPFLKCSRCTDLVYCNLSPCSNASLYSELATQVSAERILRAHDS